MVSNWVCFHRLVLASFSLTTAFRGLPRCDFLGIHFQSNVPIFSLLSAFVVPCADAQSAIRMVLGLNWLHSNPNLLLADATSWFVTIVMDLTGFVDFAKLLVGAFVHPSLSNWAELIDSLQRYDLSRGLQWIGGFINRNEVFVYSILSNYFCPHGLEKNFFFWCIWVNMLITSVLYLVHYFRFISGVFRRVCGCFLPLVIGTFKRHSSQNVLIPTLRTIGNIATGNDIQTQAVINANIIPPLLYLLANAEFDVKREAAWAITNVTSCGTHGQIKYLVNHGCIKPLCDLLPCPDLRVVTVCLQGLENILKAWDGHNNKYATLLEDAGGLDKIEALQGHENTDVYGKAVGILETYFVNEEGEGQSLDVDAHNFFVSFK